MTEPLDRLLAVLPRLAGPVVAVSGGVDSVTMAQAFAHVGLPFRAVHAVSPAVPAAATERVRELAARQGWALDCVNAGEFVDADYRRNPLNRCYFCKTNLYGALARLNEGATLVSGTNLDDLGDYRPGLIAAKEHAVRHPFVEAGLTKADVRATARRLGLGEVAELPAAPCLSSRVETGLRIEPAELALVDRVETWLANECIDGTRRCRILKIGVELQLTPADLARHGDGQALVGRLRTAVPELAGRPVRLAPYRRGSAFVGHKAAS